jgi:hypothetical protein
MSVYKLIEDRPGDQFEKIAEDSIVVTHGVDPFSCPDESPNPLNTQESMPCASSSKKQSGQPWNKSAHDA